MTLRRFIERPVLHPFASTSDEDPWAARSSADGLGAERVIRKGNTTRVERLDISEIQRTVVNGVRWQIQQGKEEEERRRWRQANPGRSLPAPLPPVPESLKSEGKKAEEQGQ